MRRYHEGGRHALVVRWMRDQMRFTIIVRSKAVVMHDGHQDGAKHSWPSTCGGPLGKGRCHSLFYLPCILSALLKCPRVLYPAVILH